ALASARAARLMCTVAGGTAVGALADVYPRPRAPAAISVRLPRVRMLTGVPLDAPACRDALERLGFGVTGTGDVFEATPPSARQDVSREVDVIEEVLRVVGYDQVTGTLPALRTAPGVRPPDAAELARAALANAGAMEAITFGFQAADRCTALGLPATDRRTQPIAVRNPMSVDQAVMRTSLVPNLLAAVARNHSHGRRDVALFEVGSVFLRRGEGAGERELHELADEPTYVSGVLSGRRPGHIGHGAPYDVFDAKSLALVAIRAVAGPSVAVRVRGAALPFLHPGVGGELLIDREVVGVFGEVHMDVRARFGLHVPVFAFDLDLARIPVASPAQMRPIPRHPASARDVSLLLAAAVPAARVEEVITNVADPLVSRVQLLEDYRDAKLGDGMKSMLWSIEYRAADRTLTDAEIDKAHEAIVGRLVEHLPAQRR
ncbi:MAG: hypothetical protein KIT31_43765, partial [Deltaproteobacteria bacterium]|nr:hypothetical protein [Deltaproteobacteria bacterium]